MLAIEEAGGGRVGLAQLEPSDRESLRRLFYRLSPETLYRRFLSPIARPEQTGPDRLLDLDHRDREAIVALDGGEIVGVARYFRKPGSDEAEMAVVVADAWQRQGIATRMLAALAEQASAAGIQRFTMMMLADNRPILRLLHRANPFARLAFQLASMRRRFPWPPGRQPPRRAAFQRSRRTRLLERPAKGALSMSGSGGFITL